MNYEQWYLKHWRHNDDAQAAWDSARKDLILLVTRAVDALACHNLDHLHDGLIAELRKAAE